MFSGIIEDIGHIVGVRPRGSGRAIDIRTRLSVAPAGAAGIGTADRERIGLGDSIAVMGACLTVEALSPPSTFTVVAGAETLSLTTLGTLSIGAKVHLERALRMGDRLDGHLVSGHVDGLGRVERITPASESVIIEIDAGAALCRYIARKGSITVDGVSLTVNEVRGTTFRINIIPFTAGHTTLGERRAGDSVNLEVDTLARYVERLMGGGDDSSPSAHPSASLTEARLRDLGYGRAPSRSGGG